MAPYLVALLIVGGALVLGLAVCRATGADPGIAPATGLASLTALAALFIRLPGDAVTAAVVCALVLAGAIVWLMRSGGVGRPDPAALLVVPGVLAVVSVQFLSAGHLGIPGMSLNNDTAVHLVWVEGLRSDLMRELYPFNPGYPMGPHALMATVAQATHTGSDHVLVGLLMAIPALLAITATLALRPASWPLRAPAGLFVGLTYLGAAWFGQGSFKEPLMSLFLLSFGMGLGKLLSAETRVRSTSFVPLGLLAAACLLTYSYLAIAWLAVLVVLAVGATLLWRRGGRNGIAVTSRAVAGPVAIGAAVALVAVAAELSRIWRYARAIGASPAGGDGGISTSNLGNLPGPLPDAEVLGIWPAGDFRAIPSADSFMLHEFKAIALLAIIGGALYLLDRRRDVGLLAVLGSGLVVWWLSSRGQSPYVTAKSLAILSPFIALISLRALLPVRWPAIPRERVVGAVRIGGAAVLVGAGLWSTQLVLRGSPVESAPQRDQLQSLRTLVKPGKTLFMGVDDYLAYRLREVQVASVDTYFTTKLQVATRPEKRYVYGNPVDWDSFSAETLDQYRYVITVNSAYHSQAPANFRKLRSTPLYEVWERTGRTQPRQVVEVPLEPASRLRCSTDPAARALSRRPGIAAVAPAAPNLMAADVQPLFTGAAAAVGVHVPAGTWHLAARYTSPVPVRLMYGSTKLFTLPANTTRPGPWWPAGTLTSDGHPQNLVLIAERVSRFTDTAAPTFVTRLEAVREGTDEVVPLQRACGRYVDWYQAQPPRNATRTKRSVSRG